MKRFTHEELLELLPAYALGALARDERDAVDAALRDGSPESAELAAELRALQEVTTQMASMHRVEPPPAVKERLLARISAEKMSAVPEGRPPLHASSWIWGSLAASLVLAAGLGIYSMRLRADLASRDQQLNTILEADQSLRVAHVLADDTVRGPGIQFYWNARQRRGMVHAFRMPPAPAGRSYQVWLLNEGKPFSVVVFNTHPDGHAIVENLTLPESPSSATLVLVTEEPAGGSPGPTTTPFMRGQLSGS